MFESSLDGFIKVDASGKVTESDQTFANMLRYANPEELVDAEIQITPSGSEPLESEIESWQPEKKSFSDEYQVQLLRKDGSLMTAGIKLWLVSDHGDNHEYWGLVKEITGKPVSDKFLNVNLDYSRQLTHHVIEAREQERRNIASALHDEIGQAMTGLKMELETLKKESCLNKVHQESISRMVSITADVIDQTHRIMANLRPTLLDSLGFMTAVEWLSSDWSERSGIRIKLNLDKCYFNPRVELSLYRIVQEALTNISRHAGASVVKIDLNHSSESLTLRIKDNGKGISKERIHHPHSFGIMGMTERAESLNGKLSIFAYKGTELLVHIPFNV